MIFSWFLETLAILWTASGIQSLNLSPYLIYKALESLQCYFMAFHRFLQNSIIVSGPRTTRAIACGQKRHS